MRKQHTFRPTALGALEDRMALSHVLVGPPAFVGPVAVPSTPAPGHTLSLNGTLSGTFVTTLNAPITSALGTTTTLLNGSGTITGLGQVNITGTVTSSLTSLTGQRTILETVTLSNAQGSVTIQLSASSQTPGTAQTIDSKFTIAKATGAFAGDIGTGTSNLQLIAEEIAVVPPTVARGVFSLTLHSNPPPLTAV
jgi:hypothetical protein